LADAPGGKPDIILIARVGVSLVVAARESSPSKDQARVVSMPSGNYSINSRKLTASRFSEVSTGASGSGSGLPKDGIGTSGDGGDIVGVERFGASGRPGNVVMEKLGFTVSHVVERATAL